MNVILVMSLSLQTLGIYTIWFSRFNIIGHQSLGFILIAYIIPGLFTDFSEGYSIQAKELYLLSSFLGCVSYILGLQASRLYSTKKRWISRAIERMENPIFIDSMGRRIFRILVFATVCLLLAYLIMGFVPMFAESPLEAKQFKGPYRDSYLRAAFLFRTGLTTAVLIMPIAAVYAIKYYRRVFLILVLVLGALVLMSLAKGAAAAWILITAGVICTRNRLTFTAYIFFCILANIAGSLFYYILDQFMNVEAFTGPSRDASFSELVALGASDLADQMGMISAFLENGENFTFGRTFLGGLIPFSYEWNPAVWTLAQTNPGTDITEIASGGYRLPVSLWGYLNFGWFGVLTLPFISGLIAGCVIQAAKRILRHSRSTISVMLVTVSIASVGLPLSGFYILSFTILPPMILLWYLFSPRLRPRRTRKELSSIVINA